MHVNNFDLNLGDWKSRFSEKVLNSGKAYYDDGKVNVIHNTYDECYANVAGTYMYRVVLRRIGPGNWVSTCTCPYNLPCKHAAAVFFARERLMTFFEEETPAQKNIRDFLGSAYYSQKNKIDTFGEEIEEEKDLPSEEEVYPFENFITKADGYHYFDMEVMTQHLSFFKKQCDDAKKLIENKQIILETVTTQFDQGTAEAHVQVGAHFYPVRIEFSNEEISEIECKCPECKQYVARWHMHYNMVIPCKCTTALLMLAGERLRKENPGDETDSSALELMDMIQKQNDVPAAEKSIEKKEVYSFVPYLEYDNDILYASFKIGSSRMYVLRKLSEFFESVQGGVSFTLGKNVNFDIKNAEFDELSQKYFDFAKKIVLDEKSKMDMMDSTYVELGYEKIKGRFVLFGKRLDDFFDISFGSKVYFTAKNRRGSETVEIALEERMPRLEAQADVIKNDFSGELERIGVTGQLPEFIYGASTKYFIDENPYTLCRVNAEDNKKISVLEKLADSNRCWSFGIGRKNFTHFMNHVLPWLRDFVDVDESELEVVQKVLPPPAKMKFFLDKDGPEVFCDAKIYYGDDEYKITDAFFHMPVKDFRDKQSESGALCLLQKYFDQSNSERQILFTDDEEKIFDLLNRGLSELKSLGDVMMSESFSSQKIRQKIKLATGVSLKSGLLDFSVSSSELNQEELYEILSGMKKKKKYIRLTNGDFINTGDENIQRLKEITDTLDITQKEFLRGKIKIPAYRALYLDGMLESNENMYTGRDKNFKNLIKEFKTVDESDFEISPELRSTMREYQVYGHKWLRTIGAYNFGGILADDMGLGKTLQTISVLLAEKENGQSGTSLIICPSSLLFNWINEFSKFAPGMKVAAVFGTVPERAKIISSYKDFDVLVTSYDLLKRDVAEYEDKEFFYAVIDEAQFIKNHSTANSKSVRTITAIHKIALTGTPIENRLSELWSIFDFLMPGFLYKYETFRKNYEAPIVKNQDVDVTENLRKMVSPFILRRLKSDVLKDLPEKIEEVRLARFGDEQKKLYDAQAVKLKKIILSQKGDDFAKNKIQILAEITRLRQICCDPSLLFENYTGESAKREACIELIQSAIEGNHKILVFSQFTSMLELLQADLKANGISFYTITGSTEKKKRVEMVKQFNEDDTQVFLISLKAGGTGLNLTGADVVIHYDPWWNLAVQNQATDRAHRIGQTKSVSVFKLIAAGTIEEKIIELQNKKSELADEILSGEGANIMSMTKDDLLALI